MSREVIEIGDKLHVMTRRFFDDDVRRHFAGEVTAGRLPELRTRVFSLGDSGHIVNKIRSSVDLSLLSYQTIQQRLVVTDGKSFTLAINEFGPKS